MTLVELLVMVTVIAVLAGAAISLLANGQGQIGVEEAAHRMAADLAFAQADAIANQADRRVVFDVAAERYHVMVGSTSLTHPVSKKPFDVDLAALYQGAGVDLAATTFSGDTLRFDARGKPNAGGSIDLTADGARWRIAVGASTGRVTLTN